MHRTDKGHSCFFYSSNKPTTEWAVGILDQLHARIDSSQSIDNRFPFKLSRPVTRINGEDRVFFLLSGSISRTLLLPDIKEDSPIGLALHYKSRHIDTVRMILTCIDEQEVLLSTDTLVLDGNSDWQWAKLTLPDNRPRLLNIEIQAIGSDLDQEEGLWLDRIELSRGGKLIAPAALPPHKARLAQKEITPFDPYDFEGYKALSPVASHPIVAIGEWMHGSQPVEKAAYEFLKYRIVHHKTQLVLMELPIEAMLSVNRFVLGDEAFELDTILLDFSIFSIPLGDIIQKKGTEIGPYSKTDFVNMVGNSLEIRTL